MKKILIDTNIYVAFKAGNSEVTETFQRVDSIGVSAIVLGELYSGFRVGKKEKQNREELEEFLNSPRVEVFHIDETTADFYAVIFWTLRRKGRPIPANDLWIAASAMQYGLSLYSLDFYFRYIEGLLLL